MDNAPEKVDGIKLKLTGCVEGEIQETGGAMRILATNSTTTATIFATIQIKGIKVKL